jgi:hypothetical protein
MRAANQLEVAAGRGGRLRFQLSFGFYLIEKRYDEED